MATDLEVLHRLTGSCNMLVFTHHAHLIDLARQALSDHVSVVNLNAA